MSSSASSGTSVISIKKLTEFESFPGLGKLFSLFKFENSLRTISECLASSLWASSDCKDAMKDIFKSVSRCNFSQHLRSSKLAGLAPKKSTRHDFCWNKKCRQFKAAYFSEST